MAFRYSFVDGVQTNHVDQDNDLDALVVRLTEQLREVGHETAVEICDEDGRVVRVVQP